MQVKLTIASFGVFVLLVGTADPVFAACIDPPLSPEKINQFKAKPGNLIPSPSTDTRTIEADTRDLAGSDAKLAEDLVRIAEKQPPRFRTAIAAGLAQAALACAGSDQTASQQIQQAVASVQDGQFQASFAAVAGDLSTAATEAAAASAAGGAGSVVVNNPNVVTATTASVAPVGAATRVPVRGIFTFSGPALSDAGTTASTPVSPTR